MSEAGSTPPGWHADPHAPGQERWWDGRAWSEHVRDASAVARQAYVVLQVVLKERFLGTGSGNLTELEHVINGQAARGYRLHTITTAASGSKGIGGGDRIQTTMVFERLDGR